MPRGQKNPPEDEVVTVGVMKEMMEQNKAYYEDLLKRQEALFQSFTQMLMDSANKRIDSLVREVQEFKSSLQYTQSEVDTLKSSLKEARSEVNILQTTIESMKCGKSQDTPELAKKMDYLENQSRRNNIVIDGVEGDSSKETWAESEEKVRNLLSKNLHLDPKTIEIERAHRNGPYKRDSQRPRQIVVKLLRFKDKQLILSKSRSLLKNTTIFINEDFSEQVRKRRAELVPAMKAARQRGDYAVINYDKLVIRKKEA
ncbi:hypothetical protein Bbelb_298790 [Branchiostoma belcheri]|nr:hypothetical protein Bbelb_298790 [Branchiostoma belcheri]